MTVARLAGVVEGQPTHAGNFLQRIDALREAEVALATARSETDRLKERGEYWAATYQAKIVELEGKLDAVALATPPAPSDAGTGYPLATRKSCSRHDDCEAADAKAKARFDANQLKPFREREEHLFSYAEHCHDDCCEDCVGS
jgi:hypothetical protein